VRAFLFAGVSALLIAGIVVLVLIHAHDVHGAPWTALGVFLMAFGALGAVLLAVRHAYQVEQEEAHPPDYDPSQN
jgi:uncharacterized membrane protein SirB2